jgi:hypothetical protein
MVTRSLLELIRIGTALGGILYESVQPAEAMQRLLARDLRPRRTIPVFNALSSQRVDDPTESRSGSAG